MSAAKPCLLLVPEFTELEWAIKPLLEDWAEVISYDLPGIGAEPLPDGVTHPRELTREMAADRGLEKVDAAGWERFFVVTDDWGIASAVRIAKTRPAAVAGLALGHAKLSLRRDGERAPIRAEVFDAMTELIRRDAPGFVRYGIAQVTRGGVDEERAARMIERIPREFVSVDIWLGLTSDVDLSEPLTSLSCPVLLAKHEGCLMSTDDGFEDAAAALPEATKVVVEEPPNASAEFAGALRDFCLRHA